MVRSYVRKDGIEEYVLDCRQDIKILGEHNLENVLAAVAISFFMDVPDRYNQRYCICL